VEVTISPGRKTASIKVKGVPLTAFRLVLRDWDEAANDRRPKSLTSGSGYKARWKCHRCGHTWEAPAAHRTVRQTRCQRCSTEHADGLNALASVRLDIRMSPFTRAKLPVGGPLCRRKAKAEAERAA
jgi:hypothetical protein